VVTRLEWGSQGSNPRFVMTNLPDEPEHLYDHIDCQRSEAEKRVKEAHVGLFATGSSYLQFAANELRVLLAALAYGLIERMRALGASSPSIQCLARAMTPIRPGSQAGAGLTTPGPQPLLHHRHQMRACQRQNGLGLTKDFRQACTALLR
jgi:hypothetical protein